MTDAGNVPYFRTISLEREPTWTDLTVRQDLLDESGSGIDGTEVETYDEFHDMLVALKDYSGKEPMFLTSTAGIVEVISVGFGVIEGYMNIDGTAVYGPAQEGWKEYVTLMNQWYNEGLIDKDFVGHAKIENMFYDGSFTVMRNSWTAFDYAETLIGEGANIVGVQAPVKNKGDIRTMAYNSVSETVLGGGNATITYNSEDVIPLIKWMDYFYSTDGSLKACWGQEGISYELDSEGNPQWKDIIYNNPDGLSMGNASALYRVGPIHPKLYDWKTNITPIMSEKSKNVGKEIWDRNYEESQTFPAVSVSAEESTEYSANMNDIKTYVEECTAKFIVGQMDIEAQWDEYIQTIENLGLGRCDEIQQAALERFEQR